MRRVMLGLMIVVPRLLFAQQVPVDEGRGCIGNGLGVTELAARANAAFNKQDFYLASCWLRLGVNAGDSKAAVALANMYRFGLNDLRKDVSEAVRLYIKAAKQGSSDAYVHLAEMVQLGEGMPKDRALARDLRLKAAELDGLSVKEGPSNEHRSRVLSREQEVREQHRQWLEREEKRLEERQQQQAEDAQQRRQDEGR